MLAVVDARTSVEQEIITGWLAQHHPDARMARLPKPGHSTAAELAELAQILGEDDSRRVVPLRVAWLPETRGGARRARLIDLLPGRNPYRPPAHRQKTIAQSRPDRARVLVGASATVEDMRQQWKRLEAPGREKEPMATFADFVARRGALALEHAQYHLLGPEYKAPHLVKEELLSSARFRVGLEQVTGAPPGPDVMAEVEAILDEFVTGWGPLFVDIIPSIGRLMYRRGFDREIDYDASQLARTREAVRLHSTITLMSHRSNLDAGILSIAMRENGLPPAHGFAGINMAYWPMGPIMRRAGVIFIRREGGDAPLYKYALRAYVGYLIEKRFNLHWSIEGTRSRTGKMLPPKLGLLSYVADAYLDGRADDVLLLPASISFDQLHEVSEYAAYARGAAKKPEGVSWLVRFARDQGAQSFGRIYVRYGEPVSMRRFLGPNGGGTPQSARNDVELRLAMQKMAFEVAWRINRATPVNATALMTSMLLNSHGRALTLQELRYSSDIALRYLHDRGIPVTRSADALADDSGVVAALDALSGSGGPVTRFDGGAKVVWAIEPQNQLTAAFYRNSIIHFFLERSIAELALRAAQDGPDGREERFWNHALELRDLLKFDFYFQERDEYRQAISEEMQRVDPQWASTLGDGSDEPRRLLERMWPLTSPVMLLPFVEAYLIVADVLVLHAGVTDEGALIKHALGLGRQYQMQRDISSDEPVSVLLFKTALALARNRGLLDPGKASEAQRLEFATLLRGILGHLKELDRLSESEERRHLITPTRPEESPR